MRPQDLLARLEAGYAYDPMYGELCNERDRLSDENAKLRELVRDMWAQLLNAYDEKELYEFAERMAELKIEEGH